MMLSHQKGPFSVVALLERSGQKEKERSLELFPSRFCFVIIIVAVHDIIGYIVTTLEDLVEIDSLILDPEGRDCVLSVNAYETLKRKCSQDWEAFKYLQERMHDVRISERGNKMHKLLCSLG
jgi:hypothetical protein